MIERSVLKTGLFFLKGVNLVRIQNGVLLGVEERDVLLDNMFVVPNGVEELRAESFKFKKIEKLMMPDSVRIIGAETFAGFAMLKQIRLSANLESIGKGAFRQCVSLSEIKLPDGLRLIDIGAFVGCSSLKGIVIPDSVESLRNYAFYACRNLEHVILPENLTQLEDYMFDSCVSLRTIDIPDGMQSIGARAFQSSGLTKQIFKEISLMLILVSSLDVLVSVNIICLLNKTFLKGLF